MTLYPHKYQNVHGNLLTKISVYRNGLYIKNCNLKNIVSVSLCFVPFKRRQIVSFPKGMTFCRSIYVKKVTKLLAFIFEQPSYVRNCCSSTAKCVQQVGANVDLMITHVF